jgi:nucleoside-diphosphate-sugar epimerase
MSPFVTLFREVLEMNYLWQREVLLDNSKLVAVLGSEPHTDLRDAVQDTLAAMGCLRPGVRPRFLENGA